MLQRLRGYPVPLAVNCAPCAAGYKTPTTFPPFFMIAVLSLWGCGIDVRVTSRRSFLSLRLNYAGVVSRKGKFITTLSSPLPYKDTQIFRAITSEREEEVRRGVA